MNGLRFYSTIGIEGFVSNPTHPLASTYLQSPSAEPQQTTSSPSSFTSWEITGVVKERPEDFVVREILPKDSSRISKIISHYNDTLKASQPDDDSIFAENEDRLRIAAMPSFSPIVLPSDHTEPTQINGEQPQKKVILGDKIPSPTAAHTTADSSGDPVPSPELSLDEIIQNYFKKVATQEYPESLLLQSLEKLNETATGRFRKSHDEIEAQTETIQSSETDRSEEGNDAGVWIPPLVPTSTDVTNDSNNNNADLASADLDVETRAQRKAFHRAIRIRYPFLKTESAAYTHKDHTSSTNATGTSSKSKRKETVKTKQEDHWIKITIETSFDELVEYLDSPQDDLRQLFLFRNQGFEGASPQANKNAGTISNTSSATLRLRPSVSKDDRRKVHHILALKNRHFETSIRQAKSDASSRAVQNGKGSESGQTVASSTTNLVVTWKKQALRKGARKNHKRKRSDDSNGGGGFNRKNLLCVLKKTQKEHLTAMQILSRSLRCQQSDIGFAGIKDMQAITYQFITIRGMAPQRAERAISRQLGPNKRDIELKILCSNVDFLLNVGDLKGNHFEITVRNVRRVQVNRVPGTADESSTLQSATESLVSCDDGHIHKMIERVRNHGFINFYGAQRIGAPGNSKDVGVRAFQVGRAMIRQNFMEAIDLLMEGTRHHETDEVRRVRQAWRDSNGDPSITLKAFQGDDIMPRERTILRGLNRYPDNALEALRFLSYNMRIFYINAYQSYVFNRAASQRTKLFGDSVVKGDLYFDTEGDHRDDVKVVTGNEMPPIEIKQVVLPLPGYNVRYPEHEIGQFYQELMKADNVKFEKSAVAEATANGSYRKLIVHPGNFTVDIDSSDATSKNMKLSFELPKGSYATMFLRELMLTTMARPEK